MYKRQIPKYPRCWAHDCEDVKDLIQAWKDGHNLVINNFDSGFTDKQELLKALEKQFEGRMAFHIYAGYKGCSSFRVHEDTANNFIMQIEGETHWKVYNERCSTLIKHGSFIFGGDESHLGEPLMDVVLTPGDMIYIPSRSYHCAHPSKNARLSMSIPLWHGLDMPQSDRKEYHIKV